MVPTAAEWAWDSVVDRCTNKGPVRLVAAYAMQDETLFLPVPPVALRLLCALCTVRHAPWCACEVIPCQVTPAPCRLTF